MTTTQQTVILGAGITGLWCAKKLAEHTPVTIIEKRSHLGGLAASFPYKGFILDIGPHKIYSIIPGVMQEYKNILGDDCLLVEKKNSIRLQGHYYSFPIKPLQILKQFSPLTGITCGLSYAKTLATQKAKNYIISYEDYFLNGFGKAAYELVFKDVAQKVWGNPKTLSADLAERRMPVPSITQLIGNIFSKKTNPEVSASHFYYPRKGLGMLIETIHQTLQQDHCKIHTDTLPISITVKNKCITSINFKKNNEEQTITPNTVISTIHLVDLINIIKPVPPQAVLEAVKNLRYRSLIIIYFIVKKQKVMEDQWKFFPEKEFIFTRVAELKNFSVEIAPENKTIITAEVGCEFEDRTFKLTDKEIYEKVIADLEKGDIIKRDDVEEYFTVRINRCYPVYDIGYKERLSIVLDYLDNIENLYVLGRQGLFNYNNTDHSIDMANKLAEHLLQNKTPEIAKEEWKKTRESFDNYRIVD